VSTPSQSIPCTRSQHKSAVDAQNPEEPNGTGLLALREDTFFLRTRQIGFRPKTRSRWYAWVGGEVASLESADRTAHS
jgi:hypothetical protein